MICRSSAARSGPTSTPSFPRRWHEAHSFLKTVAPAAWSPLDSECRAKRVDDRLPGLALVGEDGFCASPERSASPREKLLPPRRVDLGRRDAAIFERRKKRRRPRRSAQERVEDRVANRGE